MKENEIKELLGNLQPVSALKEAFIQECKNAKPRISTGFLSVDKALNGGLANELYVICGDTSTGKSTLMMSIAQNVAKQGIKVLYFTLEMGANEHIARGISSISFTQHFVNESNKELTAGNILYHTYDEAINAFTKIPFSAYSNYTEDYFKTYGDTLYLIEARLQGLSAKDIASICALYKENNPNEQLVVFVDYLQILRADSDDRSQSDRKTKNDVAARTLKVLASQIGMPVITCSSVPNNARGKKMSIASPKESGDIAYTGGVLIGWDWVGVTDTDKEEDIALEKAACHKRGYRRMLFNITKYRNAQRDNEVHLAYYPAYNLLVDEYDWHYGPVDNNPFKNWNKPLDEDDDKSKRRKM